VVTLLVSSEGGVGWVRLNRPDRRNAISTEMRAELADAFEAFEADDDVRVVVLTGVGTAFCAGVDLGESSQPPPHALSGRVEPVSAPLDRFGKPVVAAVNGAAVGGGLELALAADVRVASTDAKFGLPEVKLGSLPGSGGTQRLAHAVAPAVAARMLLTGETIDALEAHRIGLVSDLAEPDELQALAERVAGAIAANAPLSLRAAKVALRAALQAPALQLERALWALLSTTDDRQEGRAAFREKRSPNFTGK
jgi:(E)-benzylidenesuccinyl-CoA hydratase